MFFMSVYSTIQFDDDVNVPTLEGGSSRRERPLYSSGSHLHAEYTLQIVINIRQGNGIHVKHHCRGMHI